MQRQSMFQGQWELKWSAGAGTVLFVYMMTTCMFGVSEYITSMGDFFGLLLTLMVMVLPMIVGIIFNWIGALKKKRWALWCAFISYALGGLMGAVFLVYNLIPMILVGLGIYKFNKKPSIKPPRL